MKVGDMVMCEWEDACSHEDWFDITDETEEFSVVGSCTVGVLVSKTKKRVVIANTVNDQGLYCLTMVIPMGMVTRLVKLAAE